MRKVTLLLLNNPNNVEHIYNDRTLNKRVKLAVKKIVIILYNII